MTSAAAPVAKPDRVLVLGAGAAGKSTFARALAGATGIPLVELDEVFWSDGLEPMPVRQWEETQRELCEQPAWILDGDLGRYDSLAVRMSHATAVVVLDMPTWRCVVRALRRARERLDFWMWLLTWRRRELPRILSIVHEHGSDAELLVVRSAGAADNLAANWRRVQADRWRATRTTREG